MAERRVEHAAAAVALRPGQRQIRGLVLLGQPVGGMSIERQQHRDRSPVLARELVDFVEDRQAGAERR